MKKIVYLPLDERPCNYEFPEALFGGEHNIIRPPLDIMGRKKTPAPTDKIEQWFEANAKTADAIIVSVDTLIYGGIVPSRLHHLSEEQISKKLAVLKRVRKANSKAVIYAFSLIMRCPQYSSADEEPDYYEKCGREIFLKGEYLHKQELGIITAGEKAELIKIEKKIPPKDYADYMQRRAVNLKVNTEVIDLLKANVFDFLIIPQDDAAVFGHTAKDQAIVRRHIKHNALQSKVYMYPSADDTGLTLFARAVNIFAKKHPKVFVMYSSHNGMNIVPSYEDRPLGETIKYQLLAAGCIKWDNPDTADMILCVNAPSRKMREAIYQNPCREYDTERTLIDFCELIEEFIRISKPVMIGDVAYANGGDLELASILEQKKLLTKLASYAGWNTSSNTLGTCIAQGVNYLMHGATKKHLSFLALRYLEDIGYCSSVRLDVKNNDLQRLGYDYYLTDGHRGKVSKMIKAKIEKFAQEYFPSIAGNIRIKDCYMPWNRMFEVGLDVEYI